jgi:hypothetical protein
MSDLCKILIGTAATAISIKYVSELVRTGNVKTAAWSTMESACNVTENAANWTANEARDCASHARDKQHINIEEAV